MYDLVITNGTIVDGSGMPRFVADVGIAGGLVRSIGHIRERSREHINAQGRVVAPGFVDGHTHFDAQIHWDSLATSSCYHGVTSVVMGNCGFTLAPVREETQELLLSNLERSEDIPMASMKEGVEFTWESYPEFMDTLEATPKAINFAGYIGHSALRTYVMGERALSEAADEEDTKLMVKELQEAILAGAMGFSTTRSPHHLLTDGRPVASRLAEWQEVRHLVNAMGDLNAGTFQLAGEGAALEAEALRDYQTRLRDLAVEARRPVTYGILQSAKQPQNYRCYLDLLDETAEHGGRMFAQVHSRTAYLIFSFETRTPFAGTPEWDELSALPLAEQQWMLSDQAARERLSTAAKSLPPDRSPNYDKLCFMEQAQAPYPTVAQRARERGVHPVDAIIDDALRTSLKRLLVLPVANEDEEAVIEMMRHPRTLVTFSDSGAHVSQIAEASLHSHLLSEWVRNRELFTLEEAVRMLTFETASAWGFHNRGLLREGWAADLVVFDPTTIAPAMPEVAHDLPAGQPRLVQACDGIDATIVNGEVLLRGGEPTGRFPGQLLRNSMIEMTR